MVWRINSFLIPIKEPLVFALSLFVLNDAVLASDWSLIKFKPDGKFGTLVAADTGCWSNGQGWTVKPNEGALRFAPHVVRRGDTVESLLESRKIIADSDSLSFFRDLNRGEGQNFDQLRKGQTIVLPEIDATGWSSRCGAVPEKIQLREVKSAAQTLEPAFSYARSAVEILTSAEMPTLTPETLSQVVMTQAKLEEFQESVKTAALDDFAAEDVQERLGIVAHFSSNAVSIGKTGDEDAFRDSLGILATNTSTLTSARIATGDNGAGRRTVEVNALQKVAHGVVPLQNKHVCYVAASVVEGPVLARKELKPFCRYWLQKETTPAFDANVRTGDNYFWIGVPSTFQRFSCVYNREVEPRSDVDAFSMFGFDTVGDTTSCDNDLKTHIIEKSERAT